MSFSAKPKNVELQIYSNMECSFQCNCISQRLLCAGQRISFGRVHFNYISKYKFYFFYVQFLGLTQNLLILIPHPIVNFGSFGRSLFCKPGLVMIE
jgi:hypothetical protein